MKTIVLVDAIFETENYLATVAIICTFELPRNWYCEKFQLNFPVVSKYILVNSGEKVTTTKITTSKTKKNIKNFVNHHYIEKSLFSSSLLQHQNVESVFLLRHYYNKNSDFQFSDFTYGIKKDQNVENQKHQLPMAYYLWIEIRRSDPLS